MSNGAREASGDSPSAAAATLQPPKSPNRDPFVRPVLTPPGPAIVKTAGDGLAAASYGEIVVRGVVQTRADRVALVQTPDGKHYQVRAGQRLRDGRVQAVETEGLVIVPDTNAGHARGPGPVLKPLGIDSNTP